MRLKTSPPSCAECHGNLGSLNLLEPSGPHRACYGTVLHFYQIYLSWLRWSSGSVLAFSTQVRGFKPGRSRRIFKGEKIPSTPSFGGEVKPSVPCRRFAACKRSLNGVEVVISAKLPDNILAHSPHFRRWDLSRRGGRGGTWWWKVGTSKSGGKQWQATPKNFPRMQRTRGTPVAWLSSGLCPDRPKGWIPIIIIIIMCMGRNPQSLTELPVVHSTSTRSAQLWAKDWNFLTTNIKIL